MPCPSILCRLGVAMLSAIKHQIISGGAIQVVELHCAGPVPQEDDYSQRLKEHGKLTARGLTRSCWTMSRCSPSAFFLLLSTLLDPFLSPELLVLVASSLVLDNASAALLLLELVLVVGASACLSSGLDFVRLFHLRLLCADTLSRAFVLLPLSRCLPTPLQSIFGSFLCALVSPSSR